MTLASEPAGLHRCSTCGGAMEPGYVLGTVGQVQIFPGSVSSTIGWLPATARPIGRGGVDSVRAEPLANVGPHRFIEVPRFPAWRCAACHRVEFSYERPIYRADPRAVAEPRPLESQG